jgi:hypothetical protein
MSHHWKPALALCVLTVALTGLARGGDPDSNKTVGYYMKNQGDPAWRNFILGVGVGFIVANKELVHMKRAPLFCFSGDREPDPQSVLNAWIAKQRAMGFVQPGEYFGDGYYIEVAMLIAYEDSFPCTVQKR